MILIIQVLIFVLQIGVFIFLTYNFVKIINKYKSNELLKEEMENDKIVLTKSLTFFEVLRKNYFEMYIAELKDLDDNNLMEIAILQEKQSQAVEKEEYELAQKLQMQINLLTKFNKNE